MKYKRPDRNTALTPQEKRAIMRDYFRHCKKIYTKDPSAINRKIPREVVKDLTDAIGSLILARLSKTQKYKAVSKFLIENPLPASMQKLLTKETRTFCLILNALKQWVSAEQQAMDKLILGGQARKICREIMPECLLTGEKSDVLHHPVRDGRPPLFISQRGHKSIERQEKAVSNVPDTYEETIKSIRKKTHQSWENLLKASKALQGEVSTSFSTPKVASSSKSVCRRISKRTGYSFSCLEKFFKSQAQHLS